MAYADLNKTSNIDFWNAARDMDVNFASHTSEATAALFTEQGFGEVTRNSLNVINEWIGLSVRVAFQKLRAARAKNPLEDSGLVESYENAMGRFIQRITVDGIKPVSPAYKGLKDFDSVDPFVIKKAKAEEQFFGKNFDYQALITIQDFQVKEIFLSEYGMGEYLAAVMQALDNAYMLQRYVNTMEVLNYILNNDVTPLQDTQAIELDTAWGAGYIPSTDNLKEFILTAKDIASNMKVTAQSGAFNAGGFKTTYNPDDFVMLVRPRIKNAIGVELLTGAFNPEQLSLPFEVREVENFGGLVPYYNDGEADQPAYPVYDQLGSEIGFATTENAEEPDLEEDQVAFRDPNEAVIAVIAQKGVIFETIQNNYMVRSIYNPRGLYENYWASAPNNAIKYDSKYGFIAVSAKTA